MKVCRKCNIELTSGNLARGKYGNICTPCNKTDRADRHLLNKGHHNKQCNERHHENMKDPEYRSKHNARSKKWRGDNPEYYNDYYAANPEKCKAIREKHRAKPETKILRATHTRDRQARKLNATPAWANQGYIRLFYEGAKIEAERIGEPVDVDHIVPLQHPLVCGLHCEQNLQLLVHKENLTKSNTFII